MSWATREVDHVVYSISGDPENRVAARRKILKLVEEIVEQCQKVARNAHEEDDGDDIATAIKKAILG